MQNQVPAIPVSKLCGDFGQGGAIIDECSVSSQHCQNLKMVCGAIVQFGAEESFEGADGDGAGCTEVFSLEGINEYFLRVAS